jgi:hypothetical protein
MTKRENVLTNLNGKEELIQTISINPASMEDIEWIAQLESELFTGADVIPVELLKEWYNTNPTGFFVFKTSDGVRVGHINILPLRPQILELFLEGKIIERQIRGESLFTPVEKKSIKNLYIECLAVKPVGRIRAAVLYALMSEFVSMICNICPVDNMEKIYAVAATVQGEQIMRNFGFKVIREDAARQDGHKLFEADVKELFIKSAE